MPNPLSSVWLERKVRSLLGVSGDNAFTELEHARGWVVVENDRPEFKYPGGEHAFASTMTRDPAAAAFAHFAILNPAGSGVLGIVELFGHQGPLGRYGVAAESSVVLTTAGAPTRRDRRNTGTGALQAWSWEAAGIAGMARIREAVASDRESRTWVILSPGWALLQASEALDTPMTVWQEYRERPFESGRLV